MNLNGKSSKQNIIKLNDMLQMSCIMIQRSLLSTFPPYPSRLSQSMDLSSLGYIAASFLLSNLLMVVYMSVMVVVQLLTHVWLLHPYGLQPIRSPLSIEFSKQEYCSGKPFPSPGHPPDPGIKPGFPALSVSLFLSLKQVHQYYFSRFRKRHNTVN